LGDAGVDAVMTNNLYRRTNNLLVAAFDHRGIVIRVWTHVFGLWSYYFFIPLLPLAYAAVLFLIGDLRWEHIVVALASVVFGFGNKSSKALFQLILPGILIAWGDDAIRYLRPFFVTSQRVLGCSIRNVELRVFSIAPNETLSDYFAVHHTPVVDILAAIPYGIFWMVPIVYVLWLYYADRARLSYYLWSLLFAQIVAWLVWLTFPVAPPWYIREYGCTIDTNVLPSAGALLRVDHLLHTDYFQDFYSRGATTFGALPSMHCVFPMIGLLTAWRSITWTTRPFHLLYAGSMLLASVYLDHHWLLDGLSGWLLCLVAVVAAHYFLRWLSNVSTIAPHSVGPTFSSGRRIQWNGSLSNPRQSSERPS
jgi:hypothetical protein